MGLNTPPALVLVGRKNVGKSTLFNRLTKTRNALVADWSGLTRDRQYGNISLNGYECICIDTGGIDSVVRYNGIEKKIIQQSLLAIKEGDLVLFIVDAHVGLVSEDVSIARYLRKQKKNIFLVVNKTEGITPEQAISDFWSLGFGKIYPISASHGRGIAKLLEAIVHFFLIKRHSLMDLSRHAVHCLPLEGNRKYKKSKMKNNSNSQICLEIKLAIIGRPNVGKSTLINCLLNEERVVVYDLPGTTRDSIYIPMQFEGQKYVLIDTAGVRQRSRISSIIEKFSVGKTLQAIEDAHVVLLLIDAKVGLFNQDISLLGLIINSGRALVIVVNKWDELNNEEKKQVRNTLDYRLDFINFARVHFISALKGTGIPNLLKSVKEAHAGSTHSECTRILTQIIHMAVKNQQPPLMRGRRAKLKYAHIGGHNPPIVVIHGNQVKNLPNSYKQYLMNYYRKSLNIMGTPIRMHFKEEENPFSKW